MVCYANAGGTANAQRASRGKHYVLFNSAADNAAALKADQPNLGWVPDIQGHPTLPWSVASRLILQVHHSPDHPDEALFAAYPTAQLFDRMWLVGRGGRPDRHEGRQHSP